MDEKVISRARRPPCGLGGSRILDLARPFVAHMKILPTLVGALWDSNILSIYYPDSQAMPSDRVHIQSLELGIST
jgi:hypothetical protein